MLQPTPGFIPPPVPLVPVAANGIVATGGLLAGVAAGAAAGARAGAFFGPKGLVAGAVVGAVLLPLLLPQPTAPGTLPGLDPGLNEGPSPEPAPDTGVPPGEYGYPLPTQAPGETVRVRISYVNVWAEAKEYYCNGGLYQTHPASSEVVSTHDIYANGAVDFIHDTGTTRKYCVGDDSGYNFYEAKPGLSARYQNANGDEVTTVIKNVNEHHLANRDTYGTTRVWSTRVVGVEVAGEMLPGPDYPEPGNPTEPRPRKLPVPLEPLPAPSPEPAIVPSPDTEPAPDPLIVPSPDNPEAPPITIPEAPPAPPQEVPGPDEQPARTPITPVPIAPPLPVPGVPTIPEPSPDPAIVPAPGPSPNPLPVPGPDPAPSPGTTPGTDPEPSTFPAPIIPGTPEPGPITTPVLPEEPLAIDPGTGVVPAPVPLPAPTSPGNHYPESGGPAVTPGGTRPDLSAIAAEVGRIEQKVARLQNGAGGQNWNKLWTILALLEAFLTVPILGKDYYLEGVCETPDAEGNQPKEKFTARTALNIDAVNNRIDQIARMLQQHLNWKTPICNGEPQQGDWRTISFISDELSPGGKRRLDKRLRYRSQSSIGLGELVDHWAGFTWQAGPVIVKHTGAWWGTPRVWAASADEGKRVLRHAAGEAGLDPDQVGRWEVGGSGNPRLGAPGTMRVNTKGGYFWITARDGSDERPIVTKT